MLKAGVMLRSSAGRSGGIVVAEEMQRLTPAL
jgi:hypothetical protein